MKKNIFISLSVALFALLILMPSCKKEDPPPSSTPTINVSSYFNVTNGTLKTTSFPAAESDVALSNVVLNENVLAGGSSYVTFETDASVNKILVGVQDISGYYELTPSNNTRDISYDFIMIMSQSLSVSSFVVQLAILDDNNEISQIYYQTVELIGAGTGKLQISLSFDNDKDIDLHVVEPNGTRIYYGSPVSSNGGELDVDSNAGCSIDGINNENIYYSEEANIENGVYQVYVDMWENCDPAIATNFVLSVFYEGELVQALTGANPKAGTFPVNAESNYGEIENIEPVMTFEITNAVAKSQFRSFEPRPLSESAKLKLSMQK
ncbi:MAG TPA: hypothetical protein PLO05_02870 [Bacteroidales bacterium]|nr:hypothetical protein [Bacteroidales bacterium]